MPLKLLSADDFRAAVEKDGETPEGTVFKYATTESEQVGEQAARTERFTFSDATVDHSNDVIEPKGWQLGIFKSNPVALFSHMSWEPPIGRASNVAVKDGKLSGDIEFADADTYAFADTIYRLVKAKFLKAVSVGFKPIDWAFTSDKNRPSGINFTKQTLLEISICAIPANPSALSEARSVGIDTRGLVEWAEKVLDSGETAFLPRAELEGLRTQAKGSAPVQYYISGDRALKGEEAEQLREWYKSPTGPLVLPRGFELCAVATETKADDWKCGAARDLPVDEDGTWDGPAAEASIFEHAGGDDFDPAIARTGFLAYDASAPKLRGSYKLPFAQVADGKLTATASGIRAAASRLPDTDISDPVKETARTVLDHYEAAMKDGGKTVSEIVAKLKVEIDADALKEIEALVAKAGRRISAATKAKLQDALDMSAAHHDAMTKCISDAMGPEDDPDAENPDAAQTDAVDIPAQPPGSVVLESEDDLTPEQRRLKEVAALRADLPTND